MWLLMKLLKRPPETSRGGVLTTFLGKPLVGGRDFIGSIRTVVGIAARQGKKKAALHPARASRSSWAFPVKHHALPWYTPCI